MSLHKYEGGHLQGLAWEGVHPGRREHRDTGQDRDAVLRLGAALQLTVELVELLAARDQLRLALALRGREACVASTGLGRAHELGRV